MKFGAKMLPVLILAAIGWGWLAWSGRHESSSPTSSTSSPAPASAGSPAPAFGTSPYLQPGEPVEASGVVERVLPDDNSGSRHQRFIVRLASGQTLLIAHNIDIAPRVAGLARGDTVSFSGLYEANDKGGVVHWTHHDPSGRHSAGWIEHEGHRYQ
jgi:hypothetical protein